MLSKVARSFSPWKFWILFMYFLPSSQYKSCVKLFLRFCTIQTEPQKVLVFLVFKFTPSSHSHKSPWGTHREKRNEFKVPWNASLLGVHGLVFSAIIISWFIPFITSICCSTPNKGCSHKSSLEEGVLLPWISRWEKTSGSFSDKTEAEGRGASL